jgi:hypothetical protein
MIGQCAATAAKGTVAPERQRRGDDDKAHGLVEDHRLQRGEAKRADQQRQPKLRAAKADQPAECADDRAGAEGRRGAAAGISDLAGECRHSKVVAHDCIALWPVGYSAA